MCLAPPTRVTYNQPPREQDSTCTYRSVHLSYMYVLRGNVCTAEKSDMQTFLNPQVAAEAHGPIPLFKACASGLSKYQKDRSANYPPTSSIFTNLVGSLFPFPKPMTFHRESPLTSPSKATFQKTPIKSLLWAAKDQFVCTDVSLSQDICMIAGDQAPVPI